VNLRRFLTIVAVNLLVLASLLVLMEGSYRLVTRKPQFYARTFPGEHADRTFSWARPDNDLGWVFSGTNFQAFRLHDRPWTASVNREGFRASFNYGDRGPKNGVRCVMILGDSFVFGPYVSDSETMPSRLQELLGPAYEVQNYAIPGWGIDQMLLAYRKYVEAVDPDVVVLAYIDQDVLRTFEAFRAIEGMNKPSFTLVDDRLVLRESRERSLADEIAGRSLIANRFYENLYRYRASLAIARAIVEELWSESQRRGQRLVALRVPMKVEVLEGHSEPLLDLSDAFRRRGIPYLDPLHAMRASANPRALYIEDDGHPSIEGHEFLARHLQTVIAGQ
jgi:hypothetical protein